MRIERILHRADGSKIKVITTLLADSTRDEFEYRTEIAICQPRKRTFIYSRYEYEHDYTYRRLDMAERRKFDQEYCLKYVTQEEINDAKTELWMKLKPTEEAGK